MARKGYKIFKVRKDGSIGPLFIGASKRLPIGEWVEAEDIPTKGFAHRPGWHCTWKPNAPHLSLNLKSGENRQWFEIEIKDFREYNRPECQGGTWVLANKIRIIGPYKGE